MIVAVPEAAPVVDPWRERTCLDKPSIGVPAHVTLLFPFVPAELVDHDVLAELQALFARAAVFEFVIRRTAPAARGRSTSARSRPSPSFTSLK